LPCSEPFLVDVIQEQEKVLAVIYNETPMYFGNKPVDPVMVRMVAGLALVVFFSLVVILIQPSAVTLPLSHQFQAVSNIEAHSAEDLLRQLKANNLWEVQAFAEIPAVLVSRFPGDLSTLDDATQKKAFLHVLLPAAMIALSEVESERAAFEKIMVKFAKPPRRLDFGLEAQDYAQFGGLTQNEIYFLRNLCRKYRANEIADLRRRINQVPMSLIMAQGALESAWGGSRFSLKRNNLFGVLIWDKTGLVSDGQEDGKAYSGVAYDSLLDSVRAYILMINRAPAYRGLRDIREETMDSLVLANGLRSYSIRGNEYVADLSQIIRSNDLQIYDQCILVSSGGLRNRVRLASLTNLR